MKARTKASVLIVGAIVVIVAIFAYRPGKPDPNAQHVPIVMSIGLGPMDVLRPIFERRCNDWEKYRETAGEQVDSVDGWWICIDRATGTRVNAVFTAKRGNLENAMLYKLRAEPRHEGASYGDGLAVARVFLEPLLTRKQWAALGDMAEEFPTRPTLNGADAQDFEFRISTIAVALHGFEHGVTIEVVPWTGVHADDQQTWDDYARARGGTPNRY